MPANVSPYLPKIPAQQAPAGAPVVPGSGQAEPPTDVPQQADAADSDRLPAPLGLAGAQILGLALALSAALVALIRPLKAAERWRPGSRNGQVDKRGSGGASGGR